MPKTIGNPFTWTAQALGAAGSHVGANVEHLGGDATHGGAKARVRQIDLDDLRAALRKGAEDAAHFRSDAVALVLLYPAMGILLSVLALHRDYLPMLFPLAAGFALIGPAAAIGLYEMSRRRAMGEAAGWGDAFKVLRSPALGAIIALALYLAALFALWLMTAGFIYERTLGPGAPASVAAFVSDTLTTPSGWVMILAGTAAGAVFAAVALAVSLVSFPMLLDRDVGLPTAVATSVKVVAENPRAALAWGLIVAALLVLGSIPAFLGLVLVLPVLGHATWHLYRRAVAWE